MIKKGLATEYDGGKKNDAYGLRYEDEIESEYYVMQCFFSEYYKVFSIEIEAIDKAYNDFYSISTVDFANGFYIELEAKNNNKFYLNDKARFRAAIKHDNGSLGFDYNIFIYNFYDLIELYDFLKTNTITAINFSGENYKETIDIKYYKDFQKNLMSMLENINKVEEFLN